MIPAWLAATLPITGRPAKLRTCPHCQAPTLSGLDAEKAGTRAVCDPTPINTLGEAVALMGGRPTFDLVTNGGRKELNYRSAENIGGVRRYPVVPAHVCGKPLNAFIEPIPARKVYVVPDVCPY